MPETCVQSGVAARGITRLCHEPADAVPEQAPVVAGVEPGLELRRGGLSALPVLALGSVGIAFASI
jgi:hypothetical protein